MGIHPNGAGKRRTLKGLVMHEGIMLAVEQWAQTTTLQGEALRQEVIGALEGSVGRMPELLARPIRTREEPTELVDYRGAFIQSLLTRAA